MKLLFTAVLIILAAETAMSVSILHKEIEIGHNGVHYKVTVDAEEQHGRLEKGISEHEHQDERTKIGIHYELPDVEHLHHHDEKDEHHGVVILIDLGDSHDADEEHLHDEEHHSQEHHEEDLGVVHPHHNVDQYHYDTENHNLKHHVYPDLGHRHLEQDQTLSYEDLEHLLTHHDSGENKLDVPHHHAIEAQVWGNHHETKQNNVVGHQKGNLWHLFNLKVVKPVRINSGIHDSEQTEIENGYEQGDINKQPVLELHELHHHVDVHH